MSLAAWWGRYLVRFASPPWPLPSGSTGALHRFGCSDMPDGRQLFEGLTLRFDDVQSFPFVGGDTSKRGTKARLSMSSSFLGKGQKGDLERFRELTISYHDCREGQ